jgi:predicted  nucleic acid-binding Zn-ribbon protein
MDNLTKRNFNALSEGLKQQRGRSDDLYDKVSKLQTTVTHLQQQIQNLQQQVAMLLPLAYGHGSTSKT